MLKLTNHTESDSRVCDNHWTPPCIWRQSLNVHLTPNLFAYSNQYWENNGKLFLGSYLYAPTLIQPSLQINVTSRLNICKMVEKTVLKVDLSQFSSFNIM